VISIIDASEEHVLGNGVYAIRDIEECNGLD